MDFAPDSHAIRLLSVHPGHTIGEVIDNTGFELIVPDDVTETTAPSADELWLLRNIVDRDGVLTTFPVSVG
jgi:hypothetical protein